VVLRTGPFGSAVRLPGLISSNRICNSLIEMLGFSFRISSVFCLMLMIAPLILLRFLYSDYSNAGIESIPEWLCNQRFEGGTE